MKTILILLILICSVLSQTIINDTLQISGEYYIKNNLTFSDYAYIRGSGDLFIDNDYIHAETNTIFDQEIKVWFTKKYKGIIKPEWFQGNCIGEQINRAIISTEKFGSGATVHKPEIVLTSGSYNIKTPVLINRNAIRLKGSGPPNRGTLINAAIGFNLPVIVLGSNTEDIHSFYVEDLHIYGYRDSQPISSNFPGILFSSDSLYIPHDGTLRNLRVSKCPGDGIYIQSGDDVQLENVEITNNGRHGLFIENTGAVTFLTGDIENSKYFDIYLKNSHQNRILWPKVERSNSGTALYLENSSFNVLNFSPFGGSRNIVIDEQSSYNYLHLSVPGWGQFLQVNGVGNVILDNGRSEKFNGNIFNIMRANLSSELIDDWDMLKYDSDDWPILPDGTYDDFRFKRTPHSQGLSEYDRSLLISTKTSDKYIQKIINQDLLYRQSDYVLFSTYATPATGSDDYYMSGAYQDSNRLFCSKTRINPFNPGKTTDKWEGWQIRSGWQFDTFTINPSLPLELRFQGENDKSFGARILLGNVILKQNLLNYNEFTKYYGNGIQNVTDRGLRVTSDTLWLKADLSDLENHVYYLIGAKYKINNQSYIDSVSNTFFSGTLTSRGFPFYISIGSTNMSAPTNWNDCEPHWRHSQLIEKNSVAYTYRGTLHPEAEKEQYLLGIFSFYENQAKTIYLAFTPLGEFKSDYSVTISDLFLTILE